MNDSQTAEDDENAGSENFGLRQLVAVANLRDFARMVGNELSEIGSTLDRRTRGAASLPFGPVLFVVTGFVLAVRLFLLVLVLLFFGGGLVALTVLRTVARIMQTRPKDVEPPADPSDD